MNGEIICVGNELLIGKVINTNTGFLSDKLLSMGIFCKYQTVVPDDRKVLSEALQLADSRSNLIILTGGLGPTPDDLTKETVAEYLGLAMDYDNNHLQELEKYFKDKGIPMPSSNKKQALCPQGARILPNDNGTAVGYIIEQNGKTYIILPGPPSECEPMFINYAMPHIAKLDNVYISKCVLSHFGISESALCEALSDFADKENPYVATYVCNGYIDLVITAKADNAENADKLLQKTKDGVLEISGKYVFNTDGSNIPTAAVRLLKENNMTVSTAESCTAGLLSSMIASVPGASNVFECTVVSYSDRIKNKLLNVNINTLKDFGAVSIETARELALGAKNISGASFGIGITGYAGKSDDRPELSGIIFVCLFDGNRYYTKRLSTGKNRNRARQQAAICALIMLIKYLRNLPETLPEDYFD